MQSQELLKPADPFTNSKIKIKTKQKYETGGFFIKTIIFIIPILFSWDVSAQTCQAYFSSLLILESSPSYEVSYFENTQTQQKLTVLVVHGPRSKNKESLELETYDLEILMRKIRNTSTHRLYFLNENSNFYFLSESLVKDPSIIRIKEKSLSDLNKKIKNIVNKTRKERKFFAAFSGLVPLITIGAYLSIAFTSSDAFVHKVSSGVVAVVFSALFYWSINLHAKSIGTQSRTRIEDLNQLMVHEESEVLNEIFESPHQQWVILTSKEFLDAILRKLESAGFSSIRSANQYTP